MRWVMSRLQKCCTIWCAMTQTLQLYDSKQTTNSQQQFTIKSNTSFSFGSNEMQLAISLIKFIYSIFEHVICNIYTDNCIVFQLLFTNKMLILMLVDVIYTQLASCLACFLRDHNGNKITQLFFVLSLPSHLMENFF